MSSRAPAVSTPALPTPALPTPTRSPVIALALALALTFAASACSPAAPPAAPPVAPLDVPPLRESTPAATAGSNNAEPGVASSDAPAQLSASELALSEWSKATQCQDYDYFPEGGIRSFWCHRPQRLTLAALRTLAGVDIFALGPHPRDDLALDVANDFGHYNPAFVRWLVETGGPSARGSAAQKATQIVYDASVKPLAEIFWRTYEKAKADAACFDREKTAYADLIKRKKLPADYYEKWFFFMNPYFCDNRPKAATFYYDNAFDAGVSGNVTKTVIGFWLRRSLDGSIDELAKGLKSVLASYQPELLAAPARYADPAELARAIDAAVKATASCKDRKATAPTAHVDIIVVGGAGLSAKLSGARSPATPAQAMCIERQFAAQQVPSFDGTLRFGRSVSLK